MNAKLNLLRVSRISPADNLPFARQTFYKLHHTGRFPGIFIKLGGGLFIDLDALQRVMEAGRVKVAD
jgi:hypothetical protein